MKKANPLAAAKSSWARGTLASLLTVALTASSYAAPPSTPYTWRSVRIVAGGFVPGIVFSPAKQGLAYVRTDIGGFYRSDDDCRHWTPITDWVDADHGNWLGGESVAPDPTDAATVYAAAGMYSTNPAAMLRSHDRGRTWKATAVPIHMGGNEDGRGCGERLVVDPNHPGKLFFGSRYDGLWTSDDSSVTWHKVDSFPTLPTGTIGDWKHAGFGIGFVLVDPRSGGGGPSRVIYAGVSQPGSPAALFVSKDGGASWHIVNGLPAGLIAHQGAIEASTGNLFVTLGDGAGPNGVANGAVYKLDTASGQWTDITPDKPTASHGFGYAGLSLDRKRPGTLVVTTADRWSPGDDVIRSTDGGRSWKGVQSTQRLDVSMSPYLKWGKPEPREGWWMDAVAIDPFDSDHCVYGTGATIYGTHDLSNAQRRQATHWAVEADGVEETAAICLASPPAGPHLISGLGDVCGFVHNDLAVSPPAGMMNNPINNNTTGIDFAERKPSLIFRVGEKGASISTNSGATWREVTTAHGRDGTAAVTADGSHLIWSRKAGAIASTSGGRSWSPVSGLPNDAVVTADRVDPQKVYSLSGGLLYVSEDGGRSFGRRIADLPPSGQLVASPASAGTLWIASDSPQYSVDGRSFRPVRGIRSVSHFAFGKPASGRSESAVFAAGVVDGKKSVFRSDDDGLHWVNVLDNEHSFGWLPDAIAGDPRVFGRVYLGTNGRGVLYGEPK